MSILPRKPKPSIEELSTTYIDWTARAVPQESIPRQRELKSPVYNALLRRVIDANVDFMRDKLEKQAGMVTGVFGTSTARAREMQQKGVAVVLAAEGRADIRAWDMTAARKALSEADLHASLDDPNDTGRIVEVVMKEPVIDDPQSGDERWRVPCGRILDGDASHIRVYTPAEFAARLDTLQLQVGGVAMGGELDYGA